MEKSWPEVVFGLVILAHVFVAPYTKVEESFNLQAIHDFVYTDQIEKFDHITFPGVVPRTAVPAFLIAILASIGRFILRNKFYILLVSRALIGLATALALGKITKLVARNFGQRVAILFTLLTCSQFWIENFQKSS